MQRKLAGWVAAAVASGALVASPSLARAGNVPEGAGRRLTAPQKGHRPGEILVRFRAGVAEAQMDRVHAKLGAVRTRAYRLQGLQRVRIAGRLTVEEAVRAYAAEPSVAYAEPDFRYQAQALPNDPMLGELYGLHNTGQRGYADADVDAAEAWDLTSGSAGVVVAVIDTGFDYRHEDLAANAWTNAAEIPGNGVDDDANGWVDDVHGIDAANGDGDPLDDHGHGTHVSGTIGGVGNNGVGVAGVNWTVRIMGLKFLDAEGYGYTSDAVECMDYLRTMKARGVPVVASNNSWGGGEYSRALEDAIAATRDTLYLAAAGNSAQDNDAVEFYPSAFRQPNVVAVAATDYFDALASFSSFGRRTVSVAAPGVSILSTTPNGGYTYLDGTSMATPHVTGVVALLKAASPSLDWRALKNLVLAGGDRVASVTGKTITGARVSAYGSLTCNGRPVVSALKPGPIAVGQPTTLSVLSIDCAAAVGPVTGTLHSGGTVALRDDGVAPDQAAGDGVFAATWTPVQMNDQITFTSPAGSDVLPLQVAPVSVVTWGVPNAMVGTPYSTFLQGQGGALPYTWSVAEGTLPPGMSLSPAGELYGTPAASGRIAFVARVTDALGGSGTGQIWAYVQDRYEWLRLHPLVNYFRDGATGLAADASGNVFITGWVELHDNPLFTHTVAVTVKYDAAGNVLWSRTHDTGQTTRPEAVTVDAQGNAYVAGVHDSRTATGLDWIVVKYDPAGNVVRTFTYPASGEGWAYGVAVDAAGNVHVAGWTTGRKSADALLVKFAPTGKVTWAKTYDGGYADVGRAVSVDAAGNVYLAASRGNGADDDYLVQKYSSTGRALWTRTVNYVRDVPTGIGTDSAGNVYVAGTTTWGDSSSDYSDTLVAKYTASGTALWTKAMDLGGLHDAATGLVVAPGGDLYLSVTGYKIDTKDSIAYRLDPAGNVRWSKAYSDGDQSTAGIAVHGSGYVYLGSDIVRSDGSVREYLVIKYPDQP